MDDLSDIMPTIKGFNLKRDKDKLLKYIPIKSIKSEVVDEHIRDVDVTPKVKKKKIAEYKRRRRRY